MIIQWAHDENTRTLLPLNVKLARDHIYVGVGFGSQDPHVAAAVRDEVVKGIERQLAEWPADRGRLERLAERVRDQARGEQADDDPSRNRTSSRRSGPQPFGPTGAKVSSASSRICHLATGFYNITIER